MLLSRKEADLVFKLYRALMQFVNQEMKVVRASGGSESVAEFTGLSLADRNKVVEAFVGRLDLLDAFIDANPARLSKEELGIVSSWRHLVAGRFVALRQLKKQMILLACDGSRAVYGVMGLTDPIEEVIPIRLPAMIETVLLPFGDKITYAGVVSTFNIRFGPGVRKGFEEQYRAAKSNNGIVTALPDAASSA